MAEMETVVTMEAMTKEWWKRSENDKGTNDAVKR